MLNVLLLSHKSSDKATVCFSTKQQTEIAAKWQVIIVRHLEDKQPRRFFSQELVGTKLELIRGRILDLSGGQKTSCLNVFLPLDEQDLCNCSSLPFLSSLVNYIHMFEQVFLSAVTVSQLSGTVGTK